MYKRILFSLSALWLSSAAVATEFVLSDYDVNIFNSAGSLWGTELNLEFGSFGSFTPDSTNLSNWGINFVSSDVGYLDPSSPEWSTRLVTATNDGVWSVGSQLYLWAYDSKTLDGVSQWLLLTDTTWVMPTVSSTDPTVDFVLSANTVRIFGDYDYGSFSAGTALATAVPEPSTYAAVLGGLVLGVVGYRRYRRK